jgi:hypothetical protein
MYERKLENGITNQQYELIWLRSKKSAEWIDWINRKCGNRKFPT